MNLLPSCVFIILITFPTTIAQSTRLTPGGTNVQKKYEQYKTQVTTLRRQVKYIRTCTQTCGFWVFFCDTVCSNRAHYFYKTIFKTVNKTRTVYVCKTGWRQKGNDCTIPICTGGCKNSGVCSAPEVCKCSSGWRGAICDQDINECNASSGIRHGCQDTCANTPGSYKCKCQRGHFLASNGRNCTDHDECAGNTHNCEQGCENYPGGYNCICRPGYTLKNDSRSCEGQECESIHSPVNGAMRCSGNTTDHSCVFNCEPGYDLRGSSNRSCNATGQWSGVETSCQIIHCPKAAAPQHGFVYTPCGTVFRSECIVGCFRGFFMSASPKITCDANGVWQPENLTCTKTTACEKDPCQHNGTCTALSSSRYTCDCYNTGYQGINCETGYFTTPKYPKIYPQISSLRLEFQSSPLTSGHVILTPSNRDVIFTPPYLVFNSTSSRQSLAVTSNKPGVYIIQYSISGSNAAEFSPVGDDVIFVEDGINTTNQTTENSTKSLRLPVGCHELELKKCPARDDVIVLSTEPWETTGYVSSSNGVIVVRAGNLKLPLSLLGTSLPSSTRSSVDECKTSGNYQIEQLTKNHILAKAFLNGLNDSFPKWLAVKLQQGIDAKSFSFSDVKAQFLSGKKLRQTHAGQRQPITAESSFLLLQSPNVNLTIDNNADVLKSRDVKSYVSLAVDLCSASPVNVILRVHDHYANLIQNSSVFKSLKENDWDLTVYSLQISKTNSIQSLGKQRFWDGVELIRRNLKMKGNLALLAKVKRSFSGQDLSLHMEFDGTMVVAVENIDNILKSPLDQEWLVNLYGNMKLAVQLNVEGRKTNMTFNAAESISFASFGGNSEKSSLEQSNREGLYISNKLEKSPFINSELARFIEVPPLTGIEAFFKTKLRSKYAGNKTDEINEMHITFGGSLKFGPLRFEDLAIILKTQNGDVIIKGIRKSVIYGLFKTSNFALELRISGQNSRHSFASFKSSVELFGFSDVANVKITTDGVTFNTSGKIHGLYEAELNCVSTLASWRSQNFLVSGKFKSGDDSLMAVLNRILYTYTLGVYNRALKRVFFYEKREERAKSRLDSVLSFLKVKQQEFNKSQLEFNSAKKNMEAAEVHFRNFERNNSQRLSMLNSHLSKFCPEVKQCPDICQAGVVCRQCEFEMRGSSKRTCLSTCFKTETRRIETNSSFVPCERERCVRVYVKEGLVENTLQDKLKEVQNNIFSFGRNRHTQRSLDEDEISRLFPGSEKQDVCHNSEIESKQITRKLCETDDRNGHWDCNVFVESCITSGFRLEKYHAPYACERACRTHVTTEVIPKSCCETAPCAFKTVNRTCLAENILCGKIRKDALAKSTKNRFEIDLLQNFENARANLFYWQIRNRKASIRWNSAKDLLNLTQNTVKSLQKAYNYSVHSRQNISSLLADKLNLKYVFDAGMKSLSGIKLNGSSFEVELQNGGNYLIPVKLDITVNSTRKVLNTLINFRTVNSSLSGIAKEILGLYIDKAGNAHRKKRSVNNEIDKSGYAFSSLQKHHRLCSEFTNFEQALYDMSMSLFNLTTEAKELIKNSTKKTRANTVNPSKIFEKFNSTKLEIDEDSYLNSLENNKVMLAANELQTEALEDGFKPLYLNSRLLFRNWFSAMENIFKVVLRNCSGFEDCVKFIADGLSEMNDASGLPGAYEVHVMISKLRIELASLSKNTNVTLDQANEASSNILKILTDMREVKLFCARSPNVTMQPEAFTDIGEGGSLVLSCNATGDSLSYNWKFNDGYLEGQTRNTLTIANITSTNSGNYTCVVTNHISMETSTPALVVVHSAPQITIQPIKRLNAILHTNHSLRCEAESTDNNLTREWWFKAKNSSVFMKLSKKYSYLNFVPVQTPHEGWYYCVVSNSYASSRSIASYVKVLGFALPTPLASVSINLAQSEKNASIVKRSQEGIGYEDIKSELANLLSFYSKAVPATTNSTTSNSSMLHSSIAEVRNVQVFRCSRMAASKVCQWVFQYVAKNVISGQNFERNARKVIGSLEELRAVIGRLVKAANDGVLSFNLGDQRFSVEKNSVSIERVEMACSLGKKLKQSFRCVDCPPGYHGKLVENSLATCVPCPLGSYQPNSGQTQCTQCAEGFTTLNEGSIYKSQCKVICPAGTYGGVAEEISQCEKCPANAYQPNSGQNHCLPCPAGHVTETTGADDVSKCFLATTTTGRPLTTEESEDTTRRKSEKTTSGAGRVTTHESRGDARALTNDDENKSHAPAIGGAIGGVLFLCLFVLVLLFFVRRLRVARKSNSPEDDKTIIVSQASMELNSWNVNPGFDEYEDSGGERAQSENSAYISGIESAATENPKYETSVNPHLDKTGLNGIKRGNDDFTDAAASRVYGSYKNGDVKSDYGNPIYESNPVQDRVIEPEPEEGPIQDHHREPDQMNNNEVLDFGNPLYEALKTGHARKDASLQLTDIPIDDEDV